MKNSLFKNVLLFGILLTCGFMQGQDISGTVSDASGPLPGANVLIKGTNTGTTTDFDGNYTIQNVNAGDVLVYSYIGYLNQEVIVNDQSIINVTLQEDLQSLDEVIVVAYGTTTKKDLTGAIGVIGPDELTEFPATTVDQALQGRTAGVQVVSNSGAPGSSVTVNIRGVGSFANTTPLYVVDGYPIQDISYLSPNNIQSISVLKDASAAAIYGVRASNGVVIIETKKGTSGKVLIEIDSWAGYRTKPDFIDVLDAQTFANFAVETANEQGRPIYPAWENPEQLTNVNWQEFAFKNGFRTGTNITVRGGGENTRVALNAGMIEEDGTVITSEYKRYNLGLNAQFDVSEDFRVKSDVKYSYSESYGNLAGGYYNLATVFTNVPHLDPNGSTVLPFNNGNYGNFPDVSSELFRTSTNTLANAVNQDNENATTNILANIGVEYDFLNGFTAKVNIGGNSSNFAGWNFLPSYYRSSQNNDRRDNAQYNYTQNSTNEWLAEGLLEYNKEFGSHTINALVGISAQRSNFKFLNTVGTGFLNNTIRDISQADEISTAQGFSSNSTLASTFARLNYSFDSRYYLTATIRRDGVGDRFGENELWGIFPAFAAGWNIDEEAFMNDGLFDVLKLRGSYGETGSFIGIDPFSFNVTYGNGPTGFNNAGYLFGASGGQEGTPAQGLYAERLPNPDLKWETQKQTNIGLEGELLARRLYFSVDWFKKESSDFLFNETLPTQTGYTSRAVNAGSVVNKGLEFLVGYREAEGDFQWDISANVTLIDNEITSLTSDLDYTVFPAEFVPNFVDNWLGFTRSYVGGEVGTFYAYRADGIFQTQAEVDAANANAQDAGANWYQVAGTSPGDRRFRDLDGDGTITSNDREIIGSPIPDFYGGLNITLSYKNFDLGLDFYGTYGNEIMNFTRVELETLGGYGLPNTYTNVSREYYNNRWTPENPSNTYARALIDESRDHNIQNNRVSDHFMEDGSFLKLRNLRLAYNLPLTFIESIGMTGAKIYVSGQNLLTWTKYSGWDPEIGQSADLQNRSSAQTRGVDFGAYPVTSSYTLGVNLKF